VAGAVAAALAWRVPAYGQAQPPSDSFAIQAKTAATWGAAGTSIIQLDGPVTIQLGHTTLSAQAAVIWLRPAPNAVLGQQRADIALLGDARIVQGDVVRTGQQLMASTIVRGAIALTAERRLAQDQSASPAYRRALALAQNAHVLPDHAASPAQPGTTLPWQVRRPLPSLPAPPATTPATGPAAPKSPPITIRFGSLETTRTREGKVAVILSGGVLLLQERPNHDFIELRAERAVLFTTLNSLSGAEQKQQQVKRVEDAVSAAYLEGDVRITYTPANLARSAEQRLEANRVYYEFTTDRAILTDAVVHSVEPTLQMPVILRAQNIRQLAVGEYAAKNAQLTTSAFATPTYSIAAGEAYVRQDHGDDTSGGSRTTFQARNTTFNVLDFPIFYFPVIGGSLTDRGFPLRQIGISNSQRFGLGVTTTWGVFEALGLVGPRDLDLSAHVDYFSDRGPALGLDGHYNGGFITETTRDPWNFTGQFQSYAVLDHGEDDLGRATVEPEKQVRGRFLWQHQHFFPQDWQLQLRAGYSTDPTFLEEWFPDEFNNGPPHDVSLYVKRQHDTEASTFLVNVQPRDFVTNSQLMQEQFEVEHLPQFGYHRIGDSFADDNATFFSDNSLGVLRFHRSRASLADQGFPFGISPGLPAEGTTGTTGDPVFRGNFRQEVDYPLNMGPFRVVPYAEGIYTGYSDAPDGEARHRLFGGLGMRATTAFWRVDDSAESDLFDIHRLRHVIEPELNLFTSGETVDRSQVFIYDEQTDAISDISAIQLALHQRWQTKRGGPGRWRSVDFFTWNVETNLFANQPPDNLLQPTGFRGLYFPSLPETSVPRNSVNTDATWRVSDTTALLGDAQYNLDESRLATAAIGLAVRRDPRVAYYIGTRYIQELNSNITTFAVDYQLSKKYLFNFAQSYDFSQQGNVSSSITLTRRFDRFFLAVRFNYSASDNVSGVGINLIPEGVPGQFLNSAQSVFARQ
jgi:lipopolysaccharide assembly outer membrane protein LptD (OstA)